VVAGGTLGDYTTVLNRAIARDSTMSNFQVNVLLVFLLILASLLLPDPTSAQVSCQQFGNQTFCSNGQTFQRFGNQTFDNRGNSWQQFGNQTFGSRGDSYQQFGNQTFDNRGNSWQQFGNQTFGSNGTSCQRFGNQVFCR